MSIQFETPHWDAPSHIKAISTLRSGGLSQGAYASLNLADYVGDDERFVTRNRALLDSVVGLPQNPRWLKQVHGTHLVELDQFGTNSAAPEGLYWRVSTDELIVGRISDSTTKESQKRNLPTLLELSLIHI